MSHLVCSGAFGAAIKCAMRVYIPAGVIVRSIGIILLSAGAGLALARRGVGRRLADLKAAAAPSAANCFASFIDFMNASASNCPLTTMGITVYGQVDVGAGWNSHASRFSP